MIINRFTHHNKRQFIYENSGFTIQTEAEYQAALSAVLALMKKGEENVSDAESERIENIALGIQAYETIHYPFPFDIEQQSS